MGATYSNYHEWDNDGHNLEEYLCSHGNYGGDGKWHLIALNNDCGVENLKSLKLKFWKVEGKLYFSDLSKETSGKRHFTSGKAYCDHDLIKLRVEKSSDGESWLTFKVAHSDFNHHIMLHSENCDCTDKSVWILSRHRVMLDRHCRDLINRANNLGYTGLEYWDHCSVSEPDF